MKLSNRPEAGRWLSEMLKDYREKNPIVLALPRGGVPVAVEIALALDAPLNILAVRKIGHPFQSEFAVGAICENANPYWNEQILTRSGLCPQDLKKTISTEMKKMRKQIELFRDGEGLPRLDNKTVIVVDDGMATGATIGAAVRYLRKKGVAMLIAAIPVAAASSARQLRQSVDDLVCLIEPEYLSSVGRWYSDFGEVSNDDVVLMLDNVQNHNLRLSKEFQFI